mmetsp:Transcript_12711/g.49531  ORF Transcript_12711/g.49531 Transcript_12711/m.49531 type:complete len:215 (-) Transcript_12711:1275-1919(-)
MCTTETSRLWKELKLPRNLCGRRAGLLGIDSGELSRLLFDDVFSFDSLEFPHSGPSPRALVRVNVRKSPPTHPRRTRDVGALRVKPALRVQRRRERTHRRHARPERDLPRQTSRDSAVSGTLCRSGPRCDDRLARRAVHAAGTRRRPRKVLRPTPAFLLKLPEPDVHVLDDAPHAALNREPRHVLVHVLLLEVAQDALRARQPPIRAGHRAHAP